MEPLHIVTKEELPVLYEWLQKHLPNTYKMYGTVYLQLEGRWPGTRFYTLGWPEIRAVGEGTVDESESKCPQFFNHVRHLNVYGPDLADVEELVRRPEFVDWTKPVLTHANCYQSADVLEKLSKDTGTPFNKRTRTQLMIAYPGDIKPCPVPEGFEVRPIDPQLHTSYMTSTWPHRRQHTDSYIRAVIESCHSVGIFDRDGNLAAFELENEYGFSALLHVKDEYRGLGLAKCVVSLLAQKLFKENRPIPAAVIASNKPAVALHEQMGFKTISYLDWFNSLRPS
ncbi:unnamed protein product [Candidula unifasciata]|uniref:Glycine N-acyltransferase-like protein n=1 Tax=Candidula unifasciata TaxID=100452 RepID=A0A8S3Z0D7_9EUPU|nr:unnamed protein product [Candidula unifasciata]